MFRLLFYNWLEFRFSNGFGLRFRLYYNRLRFRLYNGLGFLNNRFRLWLDDGLWYDNWFKLGFRFGFWFYNGLWLGLRLGFRFGFWLYNGLWLGLRFGLWSLSKCNNLRFSNRWALWCLHHRFNHPFRDILISNVD